MTVNLWNIENNIIAYNLVDLKPVESVVEEV
jgi:hypothetical protein